MKSEVISACLFSFVCGIYSQLFGLCVLFVNYCSSLQLLAMLYVATVTSLSLSHML